MTINTSLSAPDFQTTKTHAHKHAHAAGAKPQTAPVTDDNTVADIDAISAENQVAATSINDTAGASQVIAGLRQAILQQPTQALQAQGNITPETVMALLS